MAVTKQERSWILYDWANSAYTLVITTAVLQAYFKTYVAADFEDATSTAYWGYANSISMLVIAFLAPILGGIADHKGYKKKLFSFFLGIGVLSTLALVSVDKGDWILCLVIYAISSIGFYAAVVFYDAFLVDVTTDERMDWVSAAGFAWGYIGSTIPFIGCMAIIMLKPDSLPWLDDIPAVGPALGDGYRSMASVWSVGTRPVRIAFVVTAAWWFVFSIPLLRNVKQVHYVDSADGLGHATIESFQRLIRTFNEIRQYKMVFLFLIAFFCYIDGVHTIIKMAMSFALDIGLGTSDVMVILLAVQFIGFPSALVYAWLAKQFGTRNMLLVGVGVYVFVTVFAYFVDTKWQFWVLGILVGTSQGGVQALSRSIFAKLIPKDKSAQFFGFYDIFGKFAAIMGPALVAAFTQVFGRVQTGVLSLILLFAVGGILLTFVKEPEATTETAK